MKLKCIFATFFAKECFIATIRIRHFLCRTLVGIVKIQAVGSLAGCTLFVV
jgi:hypothetical protein